MFINTFETTTNRASWTTPYFWPLNQPFFSGHQKPTSHPQGGALLVVFGGYNSIYRDQKNPPPTSKPSNLAKRRACRSGWVQTSRRYTHLKWCPKKKPPQMCLDSKSWQNRAKLIPYLHLWKDFFRYPNHPQSLRSLHFFSVRTVTSKITLTGDRLGFLKQSARHQQISRSIFRSNPTDSWKMLYRIGM